METTRPSVYFIRARYLELAIFLHQFIADKSEKSIPCDAN
jgi:hypothetical protein